MDTDAPMIDDLGTGDAGIDGPTGLGNFITNSVFNVQSCSDLSFPMPGQNTMTISCTKLQILRNILFWVLNVITLFVLFNIAVTPVRSEV